MAQRSGAPSTGAKLFYLPQYSPDLNPIEQAFAKLKTSLLKHNARSFESSRPRSATSCPSSLLSSAPTSSARQAMLQPKAIVL